jgi:hypothetical protein
MKEEIPPPPPRSPFGSTLRYQDCTLLGKLWRRRHQLLIPFEALSLYFSQPLGAEERMPLGLCWATASGLACSRMNWVYPMGEVRAMLGLKDSPEDVPGQTHDPSSGEGC